MNPSHILSHTPHLSAMATVSSQRQKNVKTVFTAKLHKMPDALGTVSIGETHQYAATCLKLELLELNYCQTHITIQSERPECCHEWNVSELPVSRSTLSRLCCEWRCGFGERGSNAYWSNGYFPWPGQRKQSLMKFKSSGSTRAIDSMPLFCVL